MKFAVMLSVGAHVLVLAIRFVPPAIDRMMNHQDIEVVLVNSRSASKPLNDYRLAQADLDGGGNTDQDRRLSSPLANTRDDTRTQQLEELKQRQVEELERKQQQLMRGLSDSRIYSGDALGAQSPETALNLDGTDATQAVREMQMLQAEIRKQTEMYMKRPRRTFIGARTKSAPEAAYIEAFRTRIEKVGLQNYPSEASRRKLYGAVLLIIEINKDGQLGMVQIRKSSGSKLLDEAALAIVRLSAPFPKFPPQLLKTTDVLEITRHMTFTRSNQLETTGSDSE